MELTIKQILEPFRAKGIDAGCEKCGPYWQVWLGNHAGARQDGVALARELANRHLREARPRTVYVPEPDVMSRPEPQEIPAFLKEDPRDAELADRDARIAELEARLAEAARKVEAAESAPPADVADLIDTSETLPQNYERLIAKWNGVNGLIQLAHDRGERPAFELITKRDRYDSGIQWLRGRMAEQL